MPSRQIDPDRLPAGTYLNTGAAASRAPRFNRFCYDLRHPENRDGFRADPEDRVLVRARDWLGLVRRGANVFPMLRLSQLCGDGLAATGAQMRGETVEQYLAGRRSGQNNGQEGGDRWAASSAVSARRTPRASAR